MLCAEYGMKLNVDVTSIDCNSGAGAVVAASEYSVIDLNLDIRGIWTLPRWITTLNSKITAAS